MDVLNQISQFLWGIPLAAAIIGVGIFSVFATKFVIYRRFSYVLGHTFGNIFTKEESHDEAITAFQAVSTALASTVGTGNIVGVATAIGMGGPGAVFWMWFAAVLGITTKFAEVTLAAAFKEKSPAGGWSGGPMYYIKNGLGKNWKWLANAFAFFATFAAFGIGSMTQANSIADAVNAEFGIPLWILGLLMAILAGMVLIGGIKRIGQFAERIVPFMAAFYILCSLVVLAINYKALPGAFADIFQGAFTGTAAVGGFVGAGVAQAIRFGIARGVFTNEAGLGSAPIAHAASNIDHPARQGLWGAFEVFVDTILVATVTALVIVSSGQWQNADLAGVQLTAAAFDTTLPGFGRYIIIIGIVLFAFTTIIGWSYYGEKSAEYLFKSSKVIKPYRVIYIISVFIGAVAKLDLVWVISDIFNALMALPNLIAVTFLMPVVVRLVKQFFDNPDKQYKLEDYQDLL